MSISLHQIVPWGRTRKEYELMFALASADLSRGVLDCGGGPAGFTAEACAAGISAVAVDPIYVFAGAGIRARFETVAGPMLDQVRATPDDWTWTFHRDPDDLLANRRAALEMFLADYDAGLRAGRYLTGELPSLPFADGAFGLALCSHLLFLYSDLLGEEFHVQALLELCRVAREVRVFPLLTLRGSWSPHVEPARAALKSAGWSSEVVKVGYELQRGGNEMLRVTRA
ncbi:MAG: SAM-dependent methyltransferase [Verrucomicrobiota bacterium]